MTRAFCIRILSILTSATLLFAPILTLQARVPTDPFFGEQWYLKKIGATQAWDQTMGSSDVIVAVLDAGFDLTHPDLVGQYWTNKKEIPNNGKDDDGNGYEDDVQGWDFVDDDTNPSPLVGETFNDTVISHGTVLAGIIAAQINNNEGIAGIAPHVLIMPLRILDEKGAGSTYDVRRAIVYAVNNGAQVINLSFVSDKSDEHLRDTIAWANDQGVVVVAAVGNGNQDLVTHPTYPACDRSKTGEDIVIGVAATDREDKKATFSNFGNGCTDVSAPGTNVFGAVYHDPSRLLTSTTYGSPWEGTSIAAPMVTAAVAILKSAYPSLTPEQVRLALKLSVDPVNEKDPRVRESMGAGRLNIARALQVAKPFASGYGIFSKNKMMRSGTVVVAEGRGSEPRVKRFNESGVEVGSFLAYNARFRGGVSVTVADVTGDGREEIITGPGQGGGPHVRVFDLNGNLLSQFFAYDPSDRNGIVVTAGDVNGDGVAEILVTPQLGGTGEVRIFNRTGQLQGLLRPFGRQTKPVHVAIGNMDDDPQNELVFTLTDQAKPVVRILDGDGRYVRDWLLPSSLKNFSLAVGDVDRDGKDDMLFGAHSGTTPSVEVYSSTGQYKQYFLAYPYPFQGGVNLCVGDIDGNGREEIFTAPGKTGGPQIRSFDENGLALSGFFAFPQHDRFGTTCAIY